MASRPPDTIPYLGEDGIEDRTEDIRRHLRLPDFGGPAWMTSHARGYADIVLHDALNNREIQRCLDRDIDADQTLPEVPNDVAATARRPVPGQGSVAPKRI